MSSGTSHAPEKCAQCGAMIDPLAHACPYCRFTTPAGVTARQHREAQAHHQAQWAAHAHHVNTSVATARMKSTGTQALVFGILGLILFCTPLGVVGIVQWFRARGMAREANAALPAAATVGLVLSVVSLFTSIGGFVLLDRAVQEDKAFAAQKAAQAEQRLGNRANATTLDRDAACLLTEAYVWKEGDGNVQGYQVKSFECIGKLTMEGPDKADIDLVRVKDVSKTYQSHACLRRGGKWYVERVSSIACY